MTEPLPRRVALLAALGAVLVLSSAASAHASLVSATPRAGEAVPTAPERVVLVFSEPLDRSFSSVRVENAEGVRLDEGDLRVDGKTASVGLPALPRGIYYVRWQALSASDGHTTRGTTPFVVGDPSLAVGLLDGASQEVETGGALEAAARAVHYAGYAAALGGVAFGAFVLPRLPDAGERGRRAVRLSVVGGAAVVVLSSVALLLFAAARNLVPGSAAGSSFDFVVGSRSGRLLLARVAGAALLAAFAGGHPSGRWAGSAVLVAALAAAGHAAAVAPLYGVVDAVHVAAVSAWLGGIGIVLWLAARRLAPASALVAAFTPFATACVAAVLLSGTVDLLALADLRTLPGSRWGVEMLVKLALVAGMLVLGAVNGFVLPRRGGAGRWLRRTVAGEFGLGLAVLAVAGLLTNGSPAYAATTAATPDVARFEAQAGDLGLELAVAPVPLVPGLHRFDLIVRDPAGGDHNITNVTLEFSMPSDRSLGEVAVPLGEVSHGEQYGAEGAYLGKPGEWRVDAKIRRTNAYDVKGTFTIVVAEEKTP